MFEQKSLMFLYCVSPLHMGAGTAIGAIDSPIQRERHTAHPMMAGSGLKGALRAEACARRGDDTRLWEAAIVDDVFGPEKQDGDASAGALSISDAQIVLFPVRSLKQSYVYATCPTALERVRRLAAAAGSTPWGNWTPPDLESNQAVVLADNLKSGNRLALEVFDFELRQAEGFGEVAKWLSTTCLPAAGGHDYFRKKIADHTVLISDDRFGYFVRSSTVVEPHVRINDETGTADDGGLFYVENLPPESVLVSLAMTSNVRRKGDRMMAAQVLEKVRGAFGNRLVQVGGDATTGRGQVVLSFGSGDVE